jgi:hypothetical protein
LDAGDPICAVRRLIGDFGPDSCAPPTTLPPGGDCPIDGPNADLLHCCEDLAYLYGDLFTASAALTTDGETVFVSLLQQGVATPYAGPVLGATNFGLELVLFENGQAGDLDGVSGGEILNNGQRLRFTVSFEGEVVEFEGDYFATFPVPAY